MYIPDRFKQPSIQVMHALIRARPLACIVTVSADGLNANHIPVVLDVEPTPFGTLRGHVARANPIWQDISEDLGTLAIFQGPDSYISPSWCPSKLETGEIVPTWNYAVAHAYGKFSVIDDDEWLLSQLGALTDQNEQSVSVHWQVSDAPKTYTERLLKNIIGFEIQIEKLIGKWKTTVVHPDKNTESVVRHLSQTGDSDALEIAGLINQRVQKEE